MASTTQLSASHKRVPRARFISARDPRVNPTCQSSPAPSLPTWGATSPTATSLGGVGVANQSRRTILAADRLLACVVRVDDRGASRGQRLLARSSSPDGAAARLGDLSTQVGGLAALAGFGPNDKQWPPARARARDYRDDLRRRQVLKARRPFCLAAEEDRASARSSLC